MVSDITDASLDSMSADRLREVCKSVGLKGGRGNESEEHIKKGIRLVRDRKPRRNLDNVKDGQVREISCRYATRANTALVRLSAYG